MTDISKAPWNVVEKPPSADECSAIGLAFDTSFTWTKPSSKYEDEIVFFEKVTGHQDVLVYKKNSGITAHLARLKIEQ